MRNVLLGETLAGNRETAVDERDGERGAQGLNGMRLAERELIDPDVLDPDVPDAAQGTA